MLDTAFPRIRGDVANAATWRFPVLTKTVAGATPAHATGENLDILAARFLAGAMELVERGVDGITTSCGFLGPLQSTLAARCPVPFAATSLLQIATIDAILPAGRRTGVVTFSSERLTDDHFRAAGAAPDTPRAGLLDTDSLYRTIINDLPELDVDGAEAEVVSAGRRLLAAHPEVGAVVLECTNMPPYAAALHAALDLPVYDIVGFVHWFGSGLRPARYRTAGDPEAADRGRPHKLQ